jgi:hypothetical protein
MVLPLTGQTSTTAGTGFLITENGYILTAYHVIEDAPGSIEVVMNDGKEYKARLIDYSPTFEEDGKDIALLKIEATGLPTLPLGDSDAVQLFDQVIAMGYPLTFEFGIRINVTGGNVTAFRTLEKGPDVLQIDAAINPGNSGGPVLDSQGSVIGIAVSRITQVGETAVEGVSFMVPIAHAVELVKKHIPTWNHTAAGSLSLSPQEIVKRATPAVVYVRWSETYLEGGRYREDFSVKKGWYSDIWNEKGFVEMTEDREKTLKSVACPAKPTVAFYEVDVAFSAHTDGGAGLIFASSEGEKWDYAILFDPDGWVGFYTLSPNGETWRAIRPWQRETSIEKGLRTLNHLKVEIRETNTLIYFNDGPAVGVNAVVPLGGVLKLAVVNFKEVTTVRFDNLYLHSDSSPAILN